MPSFRSIAGILVMGASIVLPRTRVAIADTNRCRRRPESASTPPASVKVFAAGRYPGVVLTGNDVGRQRRRQWRPARAMVGAMVTTHEPIQVLDGREATSVVTVTRLAPLGIRGKCVGQSFRHGLRPPRRVFLFGVLQSWSLGIEPDLLPPSQFQERDLAGLRGQDSKIGRKPLLEL